jgi:hypothetical protein
MAEQLELTKCVVCNSKVKSITDEAKNVKAYFCTSEKCKYFKNALKTVSLVDIDSMIGNTKDDGTIQEYETGAHKSVQEGKGAFYLIPYEAMERLAKRFEEGAVKYGARDFEKGIPVSDCVSAAMRHLMKFACNYDKEDHLAAALWNLSVVAFYEAKHVGNDIILDLPKYKEESK